MREFDNQRRLQVEARRLLTTSHKPLEVELVQGNNLPHHQVIEKIDIGSVLDVPELSRQERAAACDKLVWLETDLIRRCKRLAYWTMRKEHAETLSCIPDDLRQKTLHFHARAEKLVASGEKLRAYLIVEIQEQPEHLPDYHYAHRRRWPEAAMQDREDMIATLEILVERSAAFDEAIKDIDYQMERAMHAVAAGTDDIGHAMGVVTERRNAQLGRMFELGKTAAQIEDLENRIQELGIRAMTEEQRAKTHQELVWLENDLIRRHKRLAYWTFRKHQAETMSGIPEDLREGAFTSMPALSSW